MSGVRVETAFSAFFATSTYDITSLGPTTKTFSFLPQTTPFVPPKGCSSTVLCALKAEEVTAGAVCNAFDFVGTTSARGVRSECYPPGYSDIFYPQSTAFEDVFSFAFPGNACITGWTKACTQTLTLNPRSGSISGQILNTQTWCCPSGYVCDTGGGLRQCRSVISTATEVWVKNTPTAEVFQQATVTGFSDTQTIAVVRLAFPLQGLVVTQGSSSASTSTPTPDPTVTQPSTATRTSGTQVSSSTTGTAATGSTGLSTGQIVGVAVGSSIAGFLILGLVLFFFFRRRQTREGRDGAPVPAEFMSAGLPPPQDGGHGFNGYSQHAKMSELDSPKSLTAEMYTPVPRSQRSVGTASRTNTAELQGSQRAIEMP